MFTKFMAGMNIGEMADTAADIGFDGINLLVRDGHSITPENVAKKDINFLRNAWKEA